VNLLHLYLVLLKGTATSFAGLASLAVIHDALVTHYHVLSDQQLAETVAITRMTPGPVGLYVVSVGYYAAGLAGALVGWLAMITPALLIVPILRFAGRRVEHPRVQALLQTVVVASAGLLLSAAVPLGRDTLSDPVSLAIATIALAALLLTKLEVLWVILGASLAATLAAAIGVRT